METRDYEKEIERLEAENAALEKENKRLSANSKGEGLTDAEIEQVVMTDLWGFDNLHKDDLSIDHKSQLANIVQAVKHFESRQAAPKGEGEPEGDTWEKRQYNAGFVAGARDLQNRVLAILKENQTACAKLVEEDKARPIQDVVNEIYTDLISIISK